jgi:hypothetical protein
MSIIVSLRKGKGRERERERGVTKLQTLKDILN